MSQSRPVPSQRWMMRFSLGRNGSTVGIREAVASHDQMGALGALWGDHHTRPLTPELVTAVEQWARFDLAVRDELSRFLNRHLRESSGDYTVRLSRRPTELQRP